MAVSTAPAITPVSLDELIVMLTEIRKSIVHTRGNIIDLKDRLQNAENTAMDLVQAEQKIRAALLAAIELETEPHSDAQ